MKWNCFEFNENIIFQIDFFIAISHAKSFETMFDNKNDKIRREKFIDIIIVYYLWKHSLFEFEWKWSIDSIVIFFKINFYKINIFLVKQYEIFCNSNTILLVAFANLILTKCSLILLNINFSSFFWFWIILHLCDFVIVRFLDCMFLLKSSFDLLSKMFLLFWKMKFCNENKAIKIVEKMFVQIVILHSCDF